MKKSLYTILGIRPDASEEEIKQAYKEKAKENHPDKTGGDDSAMAEINIAYAVLRVPASRARYDETGDEDTVNDTSSVIIGIIDSVLNMAMAADPDDIGFYIACLKNKWINDYNNGISNRKKTLSELERFKKRITKKPKDDILSVLIDDKIQKAKKEIQIVEDDWKCRLAAFDILEQYKFDLPQQNFSFTFSGRLHY